MDIRKVKKLIELLEESGIAEIEINEGEESVRISRYGSGAAAPVQQFAMAPQVPAPVAAAPAATAEAEDTDDSCAIDKSGVVKAILVENAQPVEFGQPLIVIE